MQRVSTSATLHVHTGFGKAVPTDCHQLGVKVELRRRILLDGSNVQTAAKSNDSKQPNKLWELTRHGRP